MVGRPRSATAVQIEKLAERYDIVYRSTERDRFAHHVTRLAGDQVKLDPIEQMLIALQRAGRIDRAEMVRLQARYLREIRQ